jgi:hypothetical protein
VRIPTLLPAGSKKAGETVRRRKRSQALRADGRSRRQRVGLAFFPEQGKEQGKSQFFGRFSEKPPGKAQ